MLFGLGTAGARDSATLRFPRVDGSQRGSVPSRVLRTTRGSLERRHQCAFFALRCVRVSPRQAHAIGNPRRCRVPLLASAVDRRSPPFSARDRAAPKTRKKGRSSVTPGTWSWRQARRNPTSGTWDDFRSLLINLTERREAIEQASTSRRVEPLDSAGSEPRLGFRHFDPIPLGVPGKASPSSEYHRARELRHLLPALRRRPERHRPSRASQLRWNRAT